MKIGSKLTYGAPLILALCLSAAAQKLAHANDSIFKQTPASVHYDNALGLIQAQSYSEALTLLRRLQSNYPSFENITAVQTRIAVLQEADDAVNEISYYLDALNLRDSGDAQGALDSLDILLTQFPISTLADDALYLKAYVQTMDRYDFQGAQETLAELRLDFPESSYEDSAQYLTAITFEQMGDTEAAMVELENLKSRHTAFTLPFGYSMPDGNVLSRYWFDRADRRLDIIDQANASASIMRSKQPIDSGGLSIEVNVDGADLELELATSPMTQDTDWRDGQLQDQSPPVAGVFIGTVAGDDESWVRAVIVDDTISGVAYAFGRNYTMESGTLIGTLDYYQPRSAANRAKGIVDATSTDAPVHQHELVPPPDLGAANFGSGIATGHSDLRVVPMSIVVDAEFDRYHGGNGLVVALNQLNVADGIYRQFGLAIAVDEVQVFGSNDHNPLLATPSSLESYLLDFRQYRQDKRALYSDSVLTYLFTGKQRTDSTLGLAWIDTLCRTDGYDVGITTPSAIGEVLLTHELGHSLGSQHDSDTACNRDTTKIMWPNISTRTQVSFSSCSSQSVSIAHSKSCLVNSADVSLNVIGSDYGVEFVVGNLDTSVNVDAKLTIETSSSNLLTLPAGCTQISPTSASCVLAELGPGEQRYVNFGHGTVSQGSIVTGVVETIATADFSPTDNVVTYSFDSGSISTEHLIIATNNNLDNLVETSVNDNSLSSASDSDAGSVSKSGLLMLTLVQLLSSFRTLRAQ